MGCSTAGSLSFIIFWSLLKLTSIETVMPSKHLTSVTPFSSWPQSFPASESFPISLARHIRWPKYWSLSFSFRPFKEYSGLIPFRIDWFDLFAVQGTLKSLLQHNSRLSVLWHVALFTGKTIALTIQTFVSKVMSLLFYMLSRFVIAFLPRSKRLLIPWSQSLSTVIWEPKRDFLWWTLLSHYVHHRKSLYFIKLLSTSL